MVGRRVARRRPPWRTFVCDGQRGADICCAVPSSPLGQDLDMVCNTDRFSVADVCTQQTVEAKASSG